MRSVILVNKEFNIIGRYIGILILAGLAAFAPYDFKSDQKKNARVKAAYAEKEEVVTGLLKQKGVDFHALRIFIRIFKKEALLEVWACSKEENKFSLVKTYPVCSSSGEAGPKRAIGDGQVPEGFYHINRFNPNSNFYLSLGLDYPNRSDRILAGKGNAGGDIFIHGNCVTIGCIPITDDKIKEVYLLAVEARNDGQEEIPVHIFPCKMDEEGMKYLQGKDKGLQHFWKNLEEGYDRFEKGKKLPKIAIEKNGDYNFN